MEEPLQEPDQQLQLKQAPGPQEAGQAQDTGTTHTHTHTLGTTHTHTWMVASADATIQGEAGCRTAASEPLSLSGGDLALKNLSTFDAHVGIAHWCRFRNSASRTLLRHA